ncbi:MAG: Transcriptional regulator [Candidatus Moranbacteria bacterium GW2011_GWD2_37_9]|nr:MAG: Transcriptional regulator [Candidatus Moranbacteria bacterium GW2011_GWD2_37_9]
MFEQSLIQLGLSYTQAAVYEALLKSGPLPAGKIAKKTEFKRGLIYKILEELGESGLIEKKEEENKVAIFEVKHPLQLRDFAEKKQQEARDAKLALEGVLPAIVSEFNLVSQKPGILFFEGEEGIREVLADSLSSRSEIYTYADMESVVKYMDKINKDYVKKRNKLGLKKKVVMIDNEFTREYMKKYYKETTDVRFIDHELYPFSALTEIYDGTISYVTAEKGNKIGVIIKNESIYKMQKALFEFVWNNAKKID